MPRTVPRGNRGSHALNTILEQICTKETCSAAGISRTAILETRQYLSRYPIASLGSAGPRARKQPHAYCGIHDAEHGYRISLSLVTLLIVLK